MALLYRLWDGWLHSDLMELTQFIFQRHLIILSCTLKIFLTEVVTAAVIMSELNLGVCQGLHTVSGYNCSVCTPITIRAISTWVGFCRVYVLDNKCL